MRAFRLNTINNKYSSISDSKIRDIEASINTFYNSLGTSLGASGYDKDTLKEYIPAIVYTMYDGYYIYGKYFNYQNEINEYQYGLKPYIYYSCRYKKGQKDFVVNYTLDNSITIYGKLDNTEKYYTKSGYLINYNLLGDVEETVTYRKGQAVVEYPTKIKYDNIYIEIEILKEQLVTVNENGHASDPTTYEYTKYNNQKIYKENGKNEYFYFRNNKKEKVSDEGKLLKDSDVTELRYVQTMTIDGHLYSNSAVEYYTKAKEFSIWIQSKIGEIEQSDAVDAQGEPIKDFEINIGNKKIFEFGPNNDPLTEGSTFNEHRMSVIRRSIKTNLLSAIANYNSGSAGTYEFQMPIFTENDWEKLLNNISIAVFMQGMPIKSKIFNNYCIITNNKNEEVVTNDSIYMLTNENGTIVAHLPGCKELVNNQDKIIGNPGGTKVEQAKGAGYNLVDFERQTIVGDYPRLKPDGTIIPPPENRELYYYPQPYQKCYNCIVNASVNYMADDIIKGVLKPYDKQTGEYKEIGTDIRILRAKYLTVIARERYDLYRTNSQFIQ